MTAVHLKLTVTELFYPLTLIAGVLEMISHTIYVVIPITDVLIAQRTLNRSLHMILDIIKAPIRNILNSAMEAYILVKRGLLAAD